jgi:hypothetical protein
MPVKEWVESARPLQTLSIGEYWVGKDDTFCIRPELLVPESIAAGGQTTVEFTNEAWTVVRDDGRTLVAVPKTRAAQLSATCTGARARGWLLPIKSITFTRVKGQRGLEPSGEAFSGFPLLPANNSNYTTVSLGVMRAELDSIE